MEIFEFFPIFAAMPQRAFMVEHRAEIAQSNGVAAR